MPPYRISVLQALWAVWQAIDCPGMKAPEPSRPDDITCTACDAYGLSLCGVTRALSPGPPNHIQIHQTSRTVPARRIICREHDLHDAVPIVCGGWAASVVMLSDASRQILSFLLPGDLVSTVLLFEPRSHCLVEAITDVVYCTFKRTDLKATLLKHPEMFDKLSKAWIEERDRADQLIVDLGRRTADERIARLVLKSGRTTLPARHDPNNRELRHRNGVPASSASHRRCHRPDARSCEQGAIRVSSQRTDQDQRPLADYPRLRRIPAPRAYEVISAAIAFGVPPPRGPYIGRLVPETLCVRRSRSVH